jgi:hypothetical protein
MTIHNRKLADSYHAAKESHGISREKICAAMADEAMGRLMRYIEENSSLKCAGDDRAMNLELAIFEYLMDSNDLLRVEL